MAAGQTCIAYGDLRLLNCLTREVKQEPVYDDSGTDLLYFKHTIRVVGALHGRTFSAGVFDPTVQVIPNPNTSSVAGHDLSIRYLFGPRKNFQMSLGAAFDAAGNITGGTVVLSATPILSAGNLSASGVDVNNGPKARVIDVSHIAGDTYAQIEVEFEICKVECDSAGQCPNASGVLNNRWSVEDDVDRNWMTTRTFNGKLRTVSSLVNANSFRGLVVPPLQPGMRRESMRFQVSEDGLNLAYTIVDREVQFAPPAPATSWKFTHTERSEMGVTFFTEVDVILGGDRNVDKKLLISIAAQIAYSKIFRNGIGNQDLSAIVREMSVSDEYSDDGSVIHLHAIAQRIEVGSQEAIMGVPTGKIGKPIEAADLAAVVQNYDRNLSRGARAGEPLAVEGPISLVGAFAAYLQTPCSDQHSLGQGTSGTTSSPAGGAVAPVVTASIVSTIPSDGTLANFSEGHAAAMYTNYQAESVYHLRELVAQCPVARQSTTSLGGSSGASERTSAFVSLAPPQFCRTIRVSAERVGLPPDILNPNRTFSDESGINYRLIERKDLLGTPERTADNKGLRRASVELVYAADRAPVGGQSLRIGVNPWERASVYSQVFQPRPEQATA